MNPPTTVIGTVRSSVLHSSDGAHDPTTVGTQPNTATPFHKTIIDVLQSRGVPPLGVLESLFGALGSCEDKLHAIACGIIPAVFKIYDQCLFLPLPNGNGNSHAVATSHLSHHQQQQQQQSLTPQQTQAQAQLQEETLAIRCVLVRMLRSFVILARGRTVLLDSIGLARTLTLLSDPAPSVRILTCHMLTTLTSFPDVVSAVKKDRLILDAVISTFLRDPDSEVTDAAIPTLQQLTNLDPMLDEATLTKLAAVIVRTSSHSSSPATTNSDAVPVSAHERASLALLKSALQTVWNSSLHSAQKESAISVGLVEVIVPLLADLRDTETVRCATGVLASLAHTARGKQAIIAQPGAIAQACKLTLDTRAAQASPLHAAVRANSIALIRNFTEDADGLRAVGAYLIPEPSTLLSVLGTTQTAKVLEPRLEGLDAMREDGPRTARRRTTDLTSLNSTDLLWSLRALQALIKAEPPLGNGLEAAWRILDIVPRLYQCVIYDPNHPSQQQQQQQQQQQPQQSGESSARIGSGHGGFIGHKVQPPSEHLTDTVAGIHATGARCLLLLCHAHADARHELLALSRRLVASGASLPPRVHEIFAAVEGSDAKEKQARDAIEAREREREHQQRTRDQTDESNDDHATEEANHANAGASDPAIATEA